jgi:hypothetical protein
MASLAKAVQALLQLSQGVEEKKTNISFWALEDSARAVGYDR